NRLFVTLHDPAGKPLADARIGFGYRMPAMGAMPEMKGGGTVEPAGPGRFVVTYPLAMPGDWTLALGIDAPGQAHRSIELRVSPPHKGFVVQGGAGAQAGAAKSIEVPAERRQSIGLRFV